ncbi:MAG: Inner rane transport protein YdhP, partial [Bacteroidota bacterium]
MLFTFAMVQFVNVLDFMIMNPLGPTFEEEFGIKTSQFGFLVGIYTLTAGIAGLIVSSFIDKTRPKKAITVIFIGFLLGTLACAFAVDFTTMLLARAFTGAFGGLMSGMVMAFIGDTIPVQKRGAAIGIVMSAFALASVIGVPFGLFLADRYSWQTPFLAVVGIGLLVFIALRAYVPDIPRPDGVGKEKRNPFSGLVAAFSVNNHRNALILTFLLMLGQFSIIPFIASYMIHNVGFSKDQLNLIYLVGGLASVGVAPLAGKLSDKYGRYPVFAIMSVVAIV